MLVYTECLLFLFSLSSLPFHPISLPPTPHLYPPLRHLTLCTLGFFFSPVHPPIHPHPPHDPLLPTPVINFSTEPLSFSHFFLLSLRFPFPPPFLIIVSFVSSTSRNEKRGSVSVSLLTVASQNRGTEQAPSSTRQCFPKFTIFTIHRA